MRRLVSVLLCLATMPIVANAGDPSPAFQQLCADLATSADGALAIRGDDGWLFLTSELRHLGAGPFWGENAAAVSKATRSDAVDPLPAIKDFHAQLQDEGVELLVVPVPAKATVYSDYLTTNTAGRSPISVPFRKSRHNEKFIGILRDQGIEVLDLAPVFLDARAGDQQKLYCQQDSHWSGEACVLAAQKIAEQINSAAAGAQKQDYDTEWQEIEITGDLWKALGEQGLPKEKVRIRKVAAVASADDSPVLLLGDSHNLVFHVGDDMFARGAGLADQLAVELGCPVDVVAVRGSGATPARINLFRKAQKDPDYWNKKKVVVWCFSVREFTESDGWRKVPIKKPAKN